MQENNLNQFTSALNELMDDFGIGAVVIGYAVENSDTMRFNAIGEKAPARYIFRHILDNGDKFLKMIDDAPDWQNANQQMEN